MSLQILQTKKDTEQGTEDSPGSTPFPSARYLQIRFEYVHEVLDELRHQLDQTNAQLIALRTRLDTLAEKSNIERP